MHIIEEMVLFRDSQPVQHIELDTEKVKWSAGWENKPALFYRAHDVKLSKSMYWQFRDSTSHEESQPEADLVFSKLITYNFLSGDVQTAGV